MTQDDDGDLSTRMGYRNVSQGLGGGSRDAQKLLVTLVLWFVGEA